MGGTCSTASRWSSYLDRLLCDHDLFTCDSAIVQEKVTILLREFEATAGMILGSSEDRSYL